MNTASFNINFHPVFPLNSSHLNITLEASFQSTLFDSIKYITVQRIGIDCLKSLIWYNESTTLFLKWYFMVQAGQLWGQKDSRIHVYKR